MGSRVKPEDRFRAKIAIDDTGCHVWTAVKDKDGYGQFRVKDKVRQAHVWAWEQANGGDHLPEGFEIDHVCRNRACVNPDHLELVTHAENMRRQREAQTRIDGGKSGVPSSGRKQRAKFQERLAKEIYLTLAPKFAATLAGESGDVLAAARLVLGPAAGDGELESLATAASSESMAQYRGATAAAQSSEAGRLRMMALLHAQAMTPLVPAQSAATHLAKSHEVCEALGGSDAQFSELVIVEEWGDAA